MDYHSTQIENCINLSNPKEIALEKDWYVHEKELEEITKHPLLIVYDDIDKITSVMKFQRMIKIVNRNFIVSRFYEKSLKKSKWNIKEASVLAILVGELINSTNELINSWGNSMMIDPALIE